MHVVDMLPREEAVQRGVDRRSTWVQVESRVVIHPDHVIFRLGFQTLVGARGVRLLEADQLILIKGGEVLAIAGAEVAARALDPEDRRIEAGQRILLDNLGRGVAAASVGDALVGPELVGAVDKAADRIELRGFGIVPEVRDVLLG